MPAIVDLPTLVQAALAVFGALLDTDPARRHFAEALTGLRVAETKTVRGSKREIVVTADQSCLPRGLTEARWDVKARNDRRLEWRPRDPRTRYSPRGVIAMEQTLGGARGEADCRRGLAVGSRGPAPCPRPRFPDE